VPVTAKLSSKFYERFGDDIATEFVDWFNAVDLTYQTQLREVNELNWERFKSALQAEGVAIRSELREEFHTGLARTEKSLREEIHQTHRDLQKWMFIYWCGSIIALYGLRFFGPR
jgi:hypothetical protein